MFLLLAASLIMSLAAVSCRPARINPLETLGKKYGAGNYLSLDEYYRGATGVKIGLKGIVIEVDPADVTVIMESIRAEYVNVQPFRIEKNYGHADKKDKIAVIGAISPFELVTALQTRGKDDKVATSSIVKALKAIDAQANIKLTGAGIDFVEFSFTAVPPDWTAVTKLCADIAPNIITYGAGTFEVLEKEIRQYRGAILWWY